MQLPEWLKKGGLPTGSLADFKPGTVERAKVITLSLLAAWDSTTTSEQNWEIEVRRAKKENAHGLLGFGDFDTYLEQAIGKTEGEASKRFDTNAEAKRAWLK
jgi:hypothetical protein